MLLLLLRFCAYIYIYTAKNSFDTFELGNMYRSLIIVQCIQSTVMGDVLDGFFSKPINESMNVFRNPRLYPYRYHNVDNQIVRSLYPYYDRITTSNILDIRGDR